MDALLQMADMAHDRDPAIAVKLYREAMQWAEERPDDKANQKYRAAALDRLLQLERAHPKLKASR